MYIYRAAGVFSQTDGQGLLQGWNSLLVRPEPLLIKDIKVQVNKQKPNNVRPAQMKLIAIKCSLLQCPASLAASPYAIIKQAFRAEKQTKLTLAAETILVHSKL